jgi:hypothetical protein
MYACFIKPAGAYLISSALWGRELLGGALVDFTKMQHVKRLLAHFRFPPNLINKSNHCACIYLCEMRGGLLGRGLIWEPGDSSSCNGICFRITIQMLPRVQWLASHMISKEKVDHYNH